MKCVSFSIKTILLEKAQTLQLRIYRLLEEVEMDSHDVVLINANFSHSADTQRLCLPLGVLYIGALLISEGLNITLLDYNAEPKNFDEIEKEIQQINAPIFAITSLSSGYSFVKKIVPKIRKNAPNSRILLGGSITFGIPEFILQKTGVDVVVEGEAESCILPIVEAILSNKEFWNIPGVHSMVNNKIKRPQQHQNIVHDLSVLPFPAWHLVNVEEYISKSLHSWHSEQMRSFPILASRGCPYNCNFCSKTLGSGIRVRGYDLVEEIQTAIDRYHIDDIWFIDEEFALSEKRLMEMCKIMRSIPKPLTFVCSMRVDRVSSKGLRAMKNAGCRRIIYGVESGSPKILRAMNKKSTVAQASKAIIETRRYGIEAYVNFMIGYSGETEKTLRETANFMKQHRLYSGFGFTTPLPGTKLFDDAVSSKKIGDLDLYLESLDKELTTKLAINLTSMSTKRLLELRQSVQNETFPNRVVLKD